jgi:ribose 5-phosphate isomerase A
MSEQDKAKEAAGQRAAALVEPGMKLGLGTGSTAERFVTALGARMAREGFAVSGVPTSERTARLAADLGIAILSLDDAGTLDLAVDGADEVDGMLRLIKGGGGALLREKLVAGAAKRVVILVDPSKRVERLGKFALPIEVVGFGARRTLEKIDALVSAFGQGAAHARIRADQFGEPFVTDGGNLIIDAPFNAIKEPELLADALKRITGVIDHGLFIGLCHTLVIGTPEGASSVFEQPESAPVESGSRK